MSHQASLSRADAAGRRWYQDRWPWFLIAGPALVVVASFVTLGLAIKSNDGVVADAAERVDGDKVAVSFRVK